VPILGTFLLQ